MALIDDWTERMTDVATTAGAVDLAIAFELEAQAFAKATRDAADRLAAQKGADEAEAVPGDDGEQGDGSGKGDDAIEPDTPDQNDPEPRDEAEGDPDTDTEEGTRA
ncbi:hypothetical protein, partial [Escherichia coli]|uniref:hypothetical protein n=1 Tax=Escherichia coli TaxID=562 RepID=UPI0018EF273C